MKFFAVASLFTLSLASPVLEPRAADLSSQVQGNLTQTGKDIITLNNTLNQVPNNAQTIPFVTLVAIQNQSNKLSYDLGNTTAAAKASSVWTQAESKAISNQVIALKPSIFSLLDNFSRHKPAFTNQGVQGQVLKGLQSQRTATKNEGAAIGAKLVAPYKAGAPSNTTQIVNYFTKVIKVYGGT